MKRTRALALLLNVFWSLTTPAATTSSDRYYELYQLNPNRNFAPWSIIPTQLLDPGDYNDGDTFRFNSVTKGTYDCFPYRCEQVISQMKCFSPFTFIGSIRGGGMDKDNATITVSCTPWGKDDYSGSSWLDQNVYPDADAMYANYNIRVTVDGVATHLAGKTITFPAGIGDTTVSANVYTCTWKVGKRYCSLDQTVTASIPIFTATGQTIKDAISLDVPDIVTMGTDNSVRIPIKFSGTVKGSNIMNGSNAQRAKLSITQLDSNLNLKLLGESGTGYTPIVPNNMMEVAFPTSGTRELKIQIEDPADYGTKTTQLRIDATIH